MAGFAGLLSSRVGRPVLDETGLRDAYNFELTWTPDIEQSGRAEDGAGGPSLFTALQEQLGLKLEARKAPVEILVIDHVEKMPTEN